MTLLLTALGAGALAVLVLGSLYQRQGDNQIDTLIKTPRRLYSDHDESRHVESAKRRKRAEAIRADARRVELQEKQADKYSIVGRR
jgi:hypothetical protein